MEIIDRLIREQEELDENNHRIVSMGELVLQAKQLTQNHD